MIFRRAVTSRGRERGAAGLLILLVLVVGVAGWLVSGLSSTRLEIEQDKQTREALAEAKEALIGYAASDPNRPGELPCPDINNDGDTLPAPLFLNYDQNTDGTCVSLIGRLPYKRLRLPDVRDSGGELLWYALSDNFHAGVASAINSETLGQLTVAGPAPASNVVAVIFAPGPAFATQARDSANVNNIVQYLDGENATAPLTVFSSGPLDATFNDRLITISPGDLFAVVEKRVVKEVERALDDYFVTGSNVFPPPAKFDDAFCLGTAPIVSACNSDPSVDRGRIPANPTPSGWAPSALILQADASSWFQANGWRELVYYAPAYACAQPGGPNCTYCSLNPFDPRCSLATGGGFVTLNVPPGTPLANQKVVVMTAGKAMGGQLRFTSLEKTTPSNYVDLENNDDDNVYLRDRSSASFNDQATSIP